MSARAAFSRAIGDTSDFAFVDEPRNHAPALGTGARGAAERVAIR